MTRSYPEWAYLIDEAGRHWYHVANRTKQYVAGDNGGKPPARAIYAIPTRDLISVPQWVSSKDDNIISQVVKVETEKFGIKTLAGPGKVTDWKPVEHNGTRTLVQSVSIPWPFESIDKGPTEFTDFLPQYTLYKPRENSVTLWQEDSTWVAGYSRGNRWVHVQALGDSVDGAFLAGEIQLTLMELSAKGIVDQVTSVVIWAPYDLEFHRALEEGTGLVVAFETRPAPQPGASDHWHFEPHEISRARAARTRRRRAGMLVIFGILVAAILVAAAVLHLWSLENANARLRERIAENRAPADVVSVAMDKWQALSPAVDPRRSPLEVFYQISSPPILPEKGFRLTSFEVQNNKTVIIRGEASTMANALQFKGALENAEGLSDYEWEIPPPRPTGDLTEFFATGTYRF